MKKQLFLIIPALLIIVFPAFASQENKNNIKENNIQITVTPSKTCDKNSEWENHGEYVSCTAFLKQGGKAVSEAARTDIGKKKTDEAKPSITAGATNMPTTAPSPTSEITGTILPTETATPTVTPEPTGTDEIIVTKAQVNSLIEVLEKMLKFFKDLL